MFVDMLAQNRGAGELDGSRGARPVNAAHVHRDLLPVVVAVSRAAPENLPAGASAWGLPQKGATIRFTPLALEEIEE